MVVSSFYRGENWGSEMLNNLGNPMVASSRAEIYYWSLLVWGGVNVLGFLFYFMCMGVLPVCICVPCVCLVPMEARRGHRIPTFVATHCVCKLVGRCQ